MNISFRIQFLAFLMLTVIPVALQATAVSVIDLKTDSRVNPIGLEPMHLRYSWKIKGNVLQTARQIQVASSPERLKEGKSDLWDSGWVNSQQNDLVTYEGKPTTTSQALWWRVRIKDQTGQESSWSKPASFEMGLLNEADWLDAKWIGTNRPAKLPQLAPDELMGSWIGHSNNITKKYYLDLKIPDLPIVSAMAYFGTSTKGASGIAYVEGAVPVGHVKRSHRASRGFVDLSFQLIQGQSNRVVLELYNSTIDTKVSFGMRLVLADGRERIIRSDANWISESGNKVEVVAAYGEAPYGKVKAFSRRQIAPVWMRKTIEVKQPLRSARFYLSALGNGDLTINGVAVSEDVLSPAQTDYEDFAYYVTRDVTANLKQGKNVVSVLLNPGWYDQVGGFASDMSYGRPGLKALLRLDYADGKTAFITSDKTWAYKEGGLKSANIFLGERMDFRLEHDEWKYPDQGMGWRIAQELAPLTPRLIASDLPPVRRIATLKPKQTQIGKKTWLFDAGENVTGWLKLKIDAPEGSVIRIRYTEMARDNRLLNVPESHWWVHGMAQNESIVSDGTLRTYQSRFCYKGFRYFEISGLNQAPAEGDVVVYRIGNDVERNATFESSDPILNRIFENGMRSHYGNMVNSLLDCPHREKCLWGGDLHASWSFGFNAIDTLNFYRHQVRVSYSGNMHAKDVPDNVMLGKRITGQSSSFNWSVSPMFITWWLYKHAGDLDTARDYYDSMHGFLKYFEKQAVDGIPTMIKLHDHAAPVGIPRKAPNAQLIAALNFFAATERFATIATKLGKEADARWAQELSQLTHKAILSFYRSDEHTFGNGTQDSLALAFGVFKDPEEIRLLAKSLANYYIKNHYKFDGGFLSYWIYPMLSRHGYEDVALKMIRNTDYAGPAWSIVEHDATTYWEVFAFDESTWKPRSHNHHAISHPSAWMITDLAGIRLADDKVGFQHIVLGPSLPQSEKLDWIRASKTTPNGVIKSAWKIEDGVTYWNFTVPPNTIATLKIPAGISIQNIATNEIITSSDQLKVMPGDYTAIIQ
ncbi:family 78 glycoside hydrolase catalytic domain [Coraliomargarita sp. W4R53]